MVSGDLETVRQDGKNRRLLLAARDNHPQDVAAALADGADINAMDNVSRGSALNLLLAAAIQHRGVPAANSGMPSYDDISETMKLLLEAGANVGIKNAGGKNAIDLALELADADAINKIFVANNGEHPIKMPSEPWIGYDEPRQAVLRDARAMASGREAIPSPEEVELDWDKRMKALEAPKENRVPTALSEVDGHSLGGANRVCIGG